MKLRFKIVLAVLFSACLVIGIFMLSSCTVAALETPKNLRIEDEILYWDPVDGAELYTVVIDDEEYHTEEPLLDIFLLTTDYKTYSMWVWAWGDGEKTLDSEPSEKLEYRVNKPELAFREYGGGFYVEGVYSSGKIVIPERAVQTWERPVVGVLQSAFFDNETITSVVMPDSVTFLDPVAFYGCTALSRVRLSSQITELNQTFYACVSLWDVKLPAHLQTMTRPFECCNALKEISLPAEVYSLNFVYGPYNLERISVDENNPYLHSEDGCIISSESLRSPVLWLSITGTVPEGTERILIHAFTACGPAVSKVILPKSVTYIDDDAFAEARYIKELEVSEENPVYYSEGNCIIKRADRTVVALCAGSVIPDGVVGFAQGALNAVYGLNELSIPASVKSVKNVFETTFYNCNELTTIYLARGVEKFSLDLYQYNIHAILLPDSIPESDRDSLRNPNLAHSHVDAYLWDCETVYDEDGYPYATAWHVSQTGAKEDLNLYAPRRRGYTFRGWADESGEIVLTPRTEVVDTAYVRQQVELNGDLLWGLIYILKMPPAGASGGWKCFVEPNYIEISRFDAEDFTPYLGQTLYAVWQKNS